MSETRTTMSFNEGDLTVIVGGTVFTQFGEGTVTAKRLHPQASHTVGLGGSVAINKSANSVGEVTIPMLSSSGLNKMLTTYYHLFAEGGVLIPDVMITHKSTGAVIAMTECWFPSFPDLEFATEVQSIPWVLHSSFITMSA